MILYCAKCDFELPDGAACNTSKCPDCGELHLRLWDTSDGTLPGKRPFEIADSEYYPVDESKAPSSDAWQRGMDDNKQVKWSHITNLTSGGIFGSKGVLD